MPLGLHSDFIHQFLHTTPIDSPTTPTKLDEPPSSSPQSSPSLHLVCYGLGSFIESKPSRAQLACLVLLLRNLSPSVAYVYDPVLTETEHRVLAHYNLTFIACNEGGQRPVQLPHPTVFFMPHCSVQLYDRLLSANWSLACLSRTLVVGNSFSAYADACIRDQLRQRAWFIASCVEHCIKERPLRSNYHLEVAQGRCS